MSLAIELTAVALGLAYLLLAMRERRSCWIAGGLASALFLWTFREAGLPMQALLQLFYIAMAVHGWWHWGDPESGSAPAISRCAVRDHALTIASVALLTLATVLLREDATSTAALLDASTSWAGVAATWMVARKKLEAWLYWIVIDFATLLLYMDAGLLASSALFAGYTVLAAAGWRQWQLSYRRQSKN